MEASLISGLCAVTTCGTIWMLFDRSSSSMNDTDITILPIYFKMDLARLHGMIPQRPCLASDSGLGWVCD